MNDKLINYNEIPLVKIGRFLHLRGLYFASSNGLALNSLIDKRTLDALCNDPKAKPKEKRWFGLIAQKSGRVFLGIIWFKNGQRDANQKKWVFEIYEERNIELARKLTEEMSLFFEVKIDIRLVNKKPCFKSFVLNY